MFVNVTVLTLSRRKHGFDSRRDGARGRGFIEAHHTKALAALVENAKTKLEDLALLCANCHRMIHSQKPWLSIAELRAILR